MEEENRFKKARCELNVHGYQSVAQVIKATGVSKTTINELESAIRTKPRNARKETVAKLAEHYGVSVGYLIGVEDTPTIDPNSRAAQEYTGLSAAAIANIRNIHSFNPSAFEALNYFMESRAFWEQLSYCTSLAIFSLHIHKKGDSDGIRSQVERITKTQHALDLLDAMDIAKVYLKGGSSLNIPEGTVVLTAGDASNYYLSEASKAFSRFLDSYVKEQSNKYSETEEE